MTCSVGCKPVDGITACACERDVILHGSRRYPVEVAAVYPRLGEAVFYKVVRRGKLPPATHRRNVGLWSDGCHRCNERGCLAQRSEGTLGGNYR